MTIRNVVSKTVGRSTLKLKHNSPHILFGVGLVGTVASTVLACRATLKTEPILDEIKSDLEMPKDREITKEYTERDRSRDLAYIYVKSTTRLVGAYAPALVIGGVSVALLTGSHIQLTRRNATLTVAYAALHKAYMEYRDRVREEVGTEKERDLYFGTCVEKLEDENGKLKEFKTVDVNKLSPYARFFDEGSPNWHKTAEYNRIFIQCQQNYANNILVARGHLFLNEVYDMLGIEHSKAGQIVGWVANGKGDGFVDFGMFEAHQQGFINGREPSILLDFNVDGNILDLI